MERTMKRYLIDLVVWVTVFCNLGLIASAFFNFLKAGKRVGDNKISVWIHEILMEGTLLQKVLIFVMLVGVIVSLAALSEFRDSKRTIASVVMFVNAIIGISCHSCIKKIFVEHFSQNYAVINEGVGCTLMRVLYALLILAAILAVGIDIYVIYTKSSKSYQEQLCDVGVNICPGCGKTLSEEERFCDTCGFSLDKLTCPNCGAKRETTSVYCKECGERLPVLNMRKSDE